MEAKRMELLLVGALYFVPAIVAMSRSHINSGAIFALNLFLGWTVIGWVGAFVWALTSGADKTQPKPGWDQYGAKIESAASMPETGDEADAISKLERLQALRDKGALEEAEFQKLKADTIAGGGDHI
jgi:T4 superinfection immunity protein